MNKAQLIEALTDRLGDKKTATAAVDALVDTIVRSVHKGDKVNITGFGVFEKRARAARTARNPRTGETVRVKKTNVPAFRAGSTFKDVVSGSKKLPRAAAATRSTAAGAGRTTTGRSAGSRSATGTRNTSTRAAAATRTRSSATRPTTSRTTSRTASRATGRTTAKAAPKAAASRTVAKKSTTKAASKSTVRKAAPRKGKK